MARQSNLKINPSSQISVSGRTDVRIDPHALPQSFRYQTGLSGEAAEAAVSLDRGLAVVCRRLPSGIPMAMRMPMDSFEGVAVRMIWPGDVGGAAAGEHEVTIVLELLHRDPHLSLPLMVTTSMDDVIADWRAWGRILCLPLLIVEADGSFNPVENRLGAVTVSATRPRRRRSVHSKRRPRFLARRQTGDARRLRQLPAGREITSWE